ncbi:unnamed protein product [Rotaria magnacalcarata]|uniref:Uncharacterized protein n=1 Tax=Rotaria magnacalcarata TaxID=392030 RepID=A0A819DDR0_9BILA|nr:unnamed protein product [Rotaria magnacalcarata]
MTILIQIIKHLFPSKIITHHKCDLVNQLSEQIIKSNYIFLSIENENKTRQFFYSTIEELITLFNHCPRNERTLYEIIFPTNLVKTYIDFEYYTDNNLDINDHCIGASSFLKILHFTLNFIDHKHHENQKYIDITLQQFLVLEAPATVSCGEINKKLTELETKLQQFQSEKVEPAKEDAIKREKTARVTKRGLIATGAGAVVGRAAVGIAVAAPILGGVGALVVAGFLPVGVILITIAGGAVIIGGIGFLVATLIRDYGEYRTRAVQYLELLSKLCTDLQKDVEKTKLVAHKANKCSDSLLYQLPAIKRTIEEHDDHVARHFGKSVDPVYKHTGLCQIIEFASDMAT